MIKECDAIAQEFFDTIESNFACDIKEFKNNYPTYPFDKFFVEKMTIVEDILEPTSLEAFTGYLKTYSAYNTYMKTHEEDPVDKMEEKIRQLLSS